MHRATPEGAVPLDANLNLNMVAKVGELNGVYSGKVLNDELILEQLTIVLLTQFSFSIVQMNYYKLLK